MLSSARKSVWNKKSITCKDEKHRLAKHSIWQCTIFSFGTLEYSALIPVFGLLYPSRSFILLGPKVKWASVCVLGKTVSGISAGDCEHAFFRAFLIEKSKQTHHINRSKKQKKATSINFDYVVNKARRYTSWKRQAPLKGEAIDIYKHIQTYITENMYKYLLFLGDFRSLHLCFPFIYAYAFILDATLCIHTMCYWRNCLTARLGSRVYNAGVVCEHARNVTTPRWKKQLCGNLFRRENRKLRIKFQ